MTQRTEVRFKFVQRSSFTIYSGSRFQFYGGVFNVGNGILTGSQYYVPESGIYLMGHSYNKVSGTTHLARTQCNLTRSGTTRIISQYILNSDVGNTTCNYIFMVELVKGDILNFTSTNGQSRMNISSYTTDDTLNSWWGIKLNY